MKVPTSVYVESSNIVRCKSLVASGQFDTISELIDYAIRVYYDHIRVEKFTEVPHKARHEPKSKVSMRMNQWVIDGLMETGWFIRSEIPDYALEYYWTILDRIDKRASLSEQD